MSQLPILRLARQVIYGNAIKRPEMNADRNENESTPETSIGFPPITGPDARILILGSLPSRRSMEVSEYYAHPRNAFWRIMRELVGAEGEYDERCRRLIEAGIAVWDVLHSSVRPGSLDADIRMDTAMPNDFAGFFARYPGVRRVGLNGRKAEEIFRRRVVPKLDAPLPELVSLPSTSPAHAAMSFDKKLEIWRSMLVSMGSLSGEQQ